MQLTACQIKHTLKYTSVIDQTDRYIDYVCCAFPTLVTWTWSHDLMWQKSYEMAWITSQVSQHPNDWLNVHKAKY